MSLLRLSDVSAGYGGPPVVRGLSLHVDAGEVVALLGPNGAGKSTTLLALSGLVDVVAGDIEVLGRSIRGRSPHQIARSGVAHVPEDRGLFFQLTVREHLKLGAGRRAAAIERALSLFPELARLLDRRAGLLSGGEQQMLALAQAMITEPKMLVVDELSLGLAPLLVSRLLPVLRDLASSSGVGVLLVEQHARLALQIADRAYVLNHGTLVLSETATQLRAQPQLLTASYFGADLPGAP